jgi:hypothetical protein
MTPKVHLILMLGTLVSACSAPQQKPADALPQNDGLVYGLSSADLERIGGRLGLKVEHLGLHNFSFTRGNTSFEGWSHILMGSNAGNRAYAMGPLELSYTLKRPVSAQVAHQWNRDFSHIATAVAGSKHDPLSNRLRGSLILDGGVTERTVELYLRRFMTEMGSFEKLQSP